MSTHDFIAIGLGPFNLGLACLTAPIDELDGVFLEARPSFAWHPGMLLEAPRLQTPFIADLVTLADPTSPYSFLNYLKEIGRLYPFYIRESFYPLRSEYDDYCRWAAAKLPHVRFGHERDQSSTTTPTTGTWCGPAPAPARPSRTAARHLVLGTGTPPYLPGRRAARPRRRPVHNSRYLEHRERRCGRSAAITVVGSGQSAAEIYHDLLGDIDRHGYQLNWVTRSPRFFPLEYTKLTLEMTSPEYVDYFHALPEATRYRLDDRAEGPVQGHQRRPDQRDLRPALRSRTVDGPVPTRLLTNTELTERRVTRTARTRSACARWSRSRDFELRTEGLVLATGYRYRVPEFLDAGPGPARCDATAASTWPATTHRPHRAGRLPAERGHPHAQHHLARTWAWAPTATPGSSASCSAASTTRSRRRIAFQEFGCRHEHRHRPAADDRLGEFALARSTRTPTPSCCTAGSPTRRPRSG